MTFDNITDAADLSVDDLARLLGVSRHTVKLRVRDGSFDHTRVGLKPQPGGRDYRRVRFTRRQAEQIAADYREEQTA